MGLFLRLVSCVTIVAGLCAGLCYARPSWVADMGLDFWTLPEVNQHLSEQRERSEQLTETIVKFKDSVKQRELVVNGLIQQKISLDEAIALTCQATSPQHLEAALGALGFDSSDRETSVGRLLIYWVQHTLRDAPQAAAVIARLERELTDRSMKVL
jgi:hypothetical protein